MRKQVIVYDDMYQFYKDTKSKKLLASFLEYLFEGIEPTDLKGIEKTIFNSLKIRMENQRKNAEKGAKGGANSHGGGRPRNPSSELKEKTSKKQAEKQTEKQPKNKEDNNTNVLLLSSILSYDNIYSVYYGISKGFDKNKCDKLMDTKLKQGFTLDVIKKRMVLYNCECRLKQEWTYVKVLETWLTKLQPITDEQMDEELRNIARAYKEKTNTNPKFIDSDVAKTIRSDLCNEFGQGKITEIRKSEGRKQINLLLK